MTEFPPVPSSEQRPQGELAFVPISDALKPVAGRTGLPVTKIWASGYDEAAFGRVQKIDDKGVPFSPLGTVL